MVGRRLAGAGVRSRRRCCGSSRLRRRCSSVRVCQVRLRQEQGVASRAAQVAARSPAWSSSGRQQALRNCLRSLWKIAGRAAALRARFGMLQQKEFLTVPIWPLPDVYNVVLSVTCLPFAQRPFCVTAVTKDGAAPIGLQIPRSIQSVSASQP